MSNEKKWNAALELRHKQRLEKACYELHFLEGWTYIKISKLFGFKDSSQVRTFSVDYKYKNNL